MLTFGCAAITEQLGIHAVFGAFVAGVLVAESPRVREATLDALDSVITGVFAPIFFVYTGLRVTSLALPPVSISVLIIGGAIVGKVIGAGLGAKFGGMRLAPALAVGIGMSSRGSMELVVARIWARSASAIADDLRNHRARSHRHQFHHAVVAQAGRWRRQTRAG